MVSSKGKASKPNLMATRILDENRANNKENFKMAGDPSRKIIGKIPLAGVGKLMPHSSKSVAIDQVNSNHGKGKVKGLENVAGKSENFVKFRSGRKPLADLSNLNNNLNNQCRSGLSNNPRIKKDKLVGIKMSQGHLENVADKSESFVKFRSGRRSLADLSILNNNSNNQCRSGLSNNPRIKKDKLVGIKMSQGHLENVADKSESFVKFRSGRRSLADLSILNNNSKNQCRSGLSNNPRIKKDKLVGIKTSQGRTTAGSSTYMLRINHGISLTKSVVKGNTSSKPIRSGRSLLIKDNNARPNPCGLSNNPRIKKDKLVGKMSQGRTTAGSSTYMPRISLTKSTVKGNTSSKPIRARVTNMQAYSKLGRAPVTKLKSNVGISIAAKSSKNKVSVNKESVSSQGCEQLKVGSDGNSCSSDNVTVIISRSKRIRRKSYTSSLVEKSEIIGELADSVTFIKKDELKNIDDNTNPLEVVEYVDDIYQYYWSMEVQNPLPANHMAVQSDITPRMRGILVNWLIEVHLKFRLMQETLFLTVQLLDRALSVIPTKKDELQMVGLTALLLASKYEDYWHPKINELIAISANSPTRDQMLAMEKLVLKKLSFRLNLPTPYVFMLRFLKAAESDKKLEHLAFYLVELCLGEYEALKWRPSLLCASAIYLARYTLQMTPAWTGLLRKYSRYEESQLGICAAMILKFHKASCLKPTQILYEKYSSPDHGRVAALTAIDMLPACP